ncbi:MAG: hypothetical protein AAFP13_14130 [Pseudomonadota bacterium]
MSLQHNLKAAQAALEYTQSKLKKGAGNKWKDLVDTGGMNFFRVDAMRDARKGISGLGGTAPGAPESMTTYPKVKWMSRTAIACGVGNCGENASVAFVFLYETWRMKRLDWMRYNDPGDHAWLLIGRAAGSTTADYRTWGNEAVVCDPWGDIVFHGLKTPQYLYGWAKNGRYGTGAFCSAK